MEVLAGSGKGREQEEDTGRKAVRDERFLGAPPVSFREMVLVGLLGKDGNGQDQGDQAENCREGREGALSWFHTVFLVHEGEQTNWARGYINPRIPTIFAVFFLFCRITRVLAKRNKIVTGPRSRIGTAEPDPVPFTHPVAVSGHTRCREGTWSLQPSRPARGVQVRPC